MMNTNTKPRSEVSVAARVAVSELLLLKLIDSLESGLMLERPERRRFLVDHTLRDIAARLKRQAQASPAALKPFAAECCRQAENLQRGIEALRHQ